jgi:hypothetical protein
MLDKVDAMCAKRDRQRRDERITYPGTDKAIKGAIERRFR